jgi:isochorismate hydrolase
MDFRIFANPHIKTSPMPEHLSPPTLFKSLADETRARAVLLIVDQGELCVCELVCALGDSQPKISRHLAQLRNSATAAYCRIAARASGSTTAWRPICRNGCATYWPPP